MRIRSFISWTSLGILSSIQLIGNNTELQTIIQNKLLSVGMHSEDSPPFFFVQDGQLTGIEMDILELMAKKMDVKLSIKRDALKFVDVVNSVAGSHVNIGISALFPTLERLKNVQFTQAYFNINMVMIIQRKDLIPNKKPKEELETLNNKETKIGYYNISNEDMSLSNNFPNAVLVPYKDRSLLMKDMTTGILNAAYIDGIELEKWKKIKPDLALYVKSIISKQKIPLAMALPLNSNHLLQWVNFFISKIKDDGSLKKIIQKYNGEKYGEI